MRRSYAALGVAIICVLFTVGASSSGSGARITARDAPKLLTATVSDAVAQQFAVAAPSPQLPSGAALGAYAVVGVATMLAAALLCYALLQRRRAASVRRANWVVRLRGPPIPRVSIVLAP